MSNQFFQTNTFAAQNPYALCGQPKTYDFSINVNHKAGNTELEVVDGNVVGAVYESGAVFKQVNTMALTRAHDHSLWLRDQHNNFHPLD